MTERANDEEVRELRLEGTTLLAAGAVLVALLAGAFFLGRWYERGDGPGIESGPATATDQPATARPQPADVSADAGHFDRVGDLELEPEREARSRPAEEPPPATVTQTATPTDPGDYFVQVFAGRDQRAAAKLVDTLRAAGKPVRLDTERDGTDALYKVRVGGFASNEVAQDAALRLREQGYPGAWVVRTR